jgi:protein phosphatase
MENALNSFLLKRVFALNEQGGRSYNEDCIFPPLGTAQRSDRLFMVCDGVGGSSNGQVASRLVCETMSRFFKENLGEGDLPNADFLREAQKAALEAMDDYVAQHPDSAGMGSTLTLVYLHSNGALVAWCGDSRIYQVRDGQVLFQSKDHSLVQELVRQGEITAEEAEKHPQRNVILRSLTAGVAPSTIDIHLITDLQAGDYLLLCTDGLLENVNEKVLRETLSEPTDKEDLAHTFNRFAFGRTKDNYSMYLLECASIQGDTKPFSKKEIQHAVKAAEVKTEAGNGKKWWWIGVVLCILLLLLYLNRPV